MDNRNYFQFRNIIKVSHKITSPQRKAVWSKIIRVLDFKVHRTHSFNAEKNNQSKETNSKKKIFL